MKNTAMLAMCCGLVLGGCSSTSSHRYSSLLEDDDGSIENDIRQAIADYDKLAVSQDPAMAKELLGDEYTLVLSDGTVVTKAQWIEDARNKVTSYEFGRSVAMNIIAQSDNVAVVTGKWHEKAHSKGKTSESMMWYTTVFARKEGKWQVIRDHVTDLPKETREPNL